jgi:hypothetical protein
MLPFDVIAFDIRVVFEKLSSLPTLDHEFEERLKTAMLLTSKVSAVASTVVTDYQGTSCNTKAPADINFGTTHSNIINER